MLQKEKSEIEIFPIVLEDHLKSAISGVTVCHTLVRSPGFGVSWPCKNLFPLPPNCTAKEAWHLLETVLRKVARTVPTRESTLR